jgi:hypothetical protein
MGAFASTRSIPVTRWPDYEGVMAFGRTPAIQYKAGEENIGAVPSSRLREGDKQPYHDRKRESTPPSR